MVLNVIPDLNLEAIPDLLQIGNELSRMEWAKGNWAEKFMPGYLVHPFGRLG